MDTTRYARGLCFFNLFSIPTPETIFRVREYDPTEKGGEMYSKLRQDVADVVYTHLRGVVDEKVILKVLADLFVVLSKAEASKEQ